MSSQINRNSHKLFFIQKKFSHIVVVQSRLYTLFYHLVFSSSLNFKMTILIFKIMILNSKLSHVVEGSSRSYVKL